MKFYCYCMLFLFISCKHTADNKVIKEYNLRNLETYDSIHIKPQFFTLLDTSLLYPSKIWIFDTILVVLDDGYKYDGHDFIRFYDIKTKKLLRSFGKIGRGPNEYITPSFFKQSNHEILITEKMRYSILDIDSIFQNPLYVPQKFNLRGGGTAINYASKLNDSILFYHACSPWQYSLLNLRNNQRENFNNFPSFISKKGLTDFIANTKVYAGSYIMQDEYLSKYCVAYWYFPAMDIVSIKDRTTIRVTFPFDKSVNHIFILDDLNAAIEDQHFYHGDICATNSSIYCVYHKLNGRSEIHKFNWEGDFQNRFTLNETIRAICVEEESGKIFALARNANYEIDIIYYDF